MLRPLLACCSAVGLLALGGCGGGGEQPGSLPPLSAPASASASASALASASAPSAGPVPAASPSPSVPPVVKPAEADQPDAVGAEAFARYWIDELNAAYQRMDPTQVLALSEPGCQSCLNYIKSIQAGAAARERYVGGGFVVTQSLFEPASPSGTMVLVDYSAQPVTRLTRSGQVLDERSTTVKLVVEFSLVRRKDHWLVAEAKRVQ